MQRSSHRLSLRRQTPFFDRASFVSSLDHFVSAIFLQEIEMGLNSYMKAHNRLMEANAAVERANRAREQAPAQPPGNSVPQGAPRAPWPPSMPPRAGEEKVYDENFNTIPQSQWRPRPPTMPSSSHRSNAAPPYPQNPQYPQYPQYPQQQQYPQHQQYPQPAPPPLYPQQPAPAHPQAAPHAPDIENQAAAAIVGQCMPTVCCVATFAGISVLGGIAYAISSRASSGY